MGVWTGDAEWMVRVGERRTKSNQLCASTRMEKYLFKICHHFFFSFFLLFFDIWPILRGRYAHLRPQRDCIVPGKESSIPELKMTAWWCSNPQDEWMCRQHSPLHSHLTQTDSILLHLDLCNKRRNTTSFQNHLDRNSRYQSDFSDRIATRFRPDIYKKKGAFSTRVIECKYSALLVFDVS